MYPIKLKKKVDIVGLDLFGRKAKITFCPSQRRGWWWSPSKKSPLVEINPSLICSGRRRTKLVYGNHKLEVFEHIGPLRWFNLCDLMIESTPWPPYHGRSLELWKAIKDSCEVDTSREVPWYTPVKTIRWTYPKARGSQIAYTEIRPNNEKRLKITVEGSWLDFPSGQLDLVFPGTDALEEISGVHSQGLPPALYHLLRIPAFLGWPHHNKFTWSQEFTREQVLNKFLQHRTGDLLGILALLCKDGLLSADVTSVCSGHKADINVVMRAGSLLRPL